MSQEIIKVLDNLCEKFGIAIDWTSQNVKPYLQELFCKVYKLRDGNFNYVVSYFCISTCV